jgi:CRISPR-associated endonuclease Cas1 subtype II
MSWRTVVINSRCKLEFKLNYLIIRGHETKKIHISEIAVLIVESTAVALTAMLMSKLIENKVKVIFCDNKHNPQTELLPYSNHYKNSGNIKAQTMWKESTKQKVWAKIIEYKICQQEKFLEDLSLQYSSELLNSYKKNVMPNDFTNREGHSAKVYFNAIFGLDFCRRSEDLINSALNYGYAIVLSAFNREIVSSGYLTQLGIFHKNEYNMFNLSSDLMEPFRILVDRVVINMKLEKIGPEEKLSLVNILNYKVLINNKKQYLTNAISVYCKSVFDALNKNKPDMVKNYEL